MTRTQLKTLLDDHYKEHAYAGIKTTIEREKKNGNYEDVTYIEELYITFTNEYTRVGEVKSFSTNSVNMKFIGSSSEGTYYFAANCEFYIGDTKSTAAALKKLADSGTVYVKVTVNADEKVSKVIMSEDTFDEGKKDTSRTYKVKSLNDKKLVVEENKETTTFTFGSTNPLDNITFYGYKNKDWENLGNVDKAEAFADDTDDTMYCKVVMNKSNKVTEIYLSTDKQAWNKTSDEKRERKGTVASIQNDVLKFKTSSVSYTMLDKYNTKDSDNTIKIGSTETKSKKLLTRLANDSAFELYAEIVADGNNKVTEVDARLTAATGMDALTHAIEGYTTKGAWEMTDMFHLKAIELISKNLRGACENTKEGREGMALGQYIAGMGFSNVGLGIAHSMAHTLGAVYDTPHGVACAMMLPIVMEYNADCTGEKYREIARATGVEGVDQMDQATYRKAAVDAVRKLSEDVGIPSKLEALKEEDLPFLAESAHADACAPGNPKDASVEDLKALFRKLM